VGDEPARRSFHDEDADLRVLEGETVAVLGYGIQGRAQALTLRDSGVRVIVGNRADEYAARAGRDGFAVAGLREAVARATLALVLLPDELHGPVYEQAIAPELGAGRGLVFAHGFSVRYGLVKPPEHVDLMLLAPRLPGQYLRQRYLEGWGVPAFVGVERDASGRAWPRLLALARALGITRCAAIESSFAEETELDHFSEHFIYPLIFATLELAFETLTQSGYAPEAARLELHGSSEIGEVLRAASREGLYGMIASHASPACQVGIAHHWRDAPGSADDVRRRMTEVLEAIRSGAFARHLAAEQSAGYPELASWRASRPAALERAEATLRQLLRDPASRGR
jgi:ketol-acid reductoisomerase